MHPDRLGQVLMSVEAESLAKVAAISFADSSYGGVDEEEGRYKIQQ